MTRIRLVSLVAAVTSCAVLLLVGTAWAGLKLADGWGREELWQDCATDATLSGPQGYCVVVSRYPATPVHSRRTYLEIAPVRDGKPDDYRFVAAYPFSDGSAGDPLEVDWSALAERIVVRDPETGASITYTAEQYAGGR